MMEPVRARIAGSWVAVSISRTCAVPSDGRTKPSSIRMVVVFPAGRSAPGSRRSRRALPSGRDYPRPPGAHSA